MNEPQTNTYEFGEFRIDGSKRLLIKEIDEIIPLTPKVFDLLFYLVQNSGKVIEKDELMTAIWTDTIVEESNLSQNISILRRVLGEKRGEHRFIATIPGHGYKFVADVSRIGEEEIRNESAAAEPSAVEEGFSFRELQISDDKFQNKARKPEIENQIRNPKSAIQNRKRFFALIVLSVLALGAGFFLWRGNEKSADAPIKTIAVLPFKPLVAEHRDEVLEMGMADTLISRLGHNREIVVRPLSSVRKFGNLDQDALTAGRLLDVESVLDGSIQHWGDKIRVNVRLIKVADGSLLWTGTFDENFTHIFVVQDAISNRVATALKLHLDSDEKMRLTKNYTENTEAYQLYLKGRYHLLKTTRSEIQTGVSYFGQAIEIDPNYALAYVGLADGYRSLVIAGEMRPTEYLPKAKAAAQKAIEIDDALAEAHAILGFIIFWYDWNWNAAENQYKQALELDPNNADTHLFYGHLLSNTGRHTEALAEAKRARDLDPLNLRINALEGQFLIHAGQIDEAITRFQKTSELDANYWLSHSLIASAYIEKGMYSEAIAKARIARELSGTNIQPISFLGYALAKSGRQAEAQAELNELLKLSTERYVSPYIIALISNGLGESDQTLAWLERGIEQRDPRMVFLKVEPKWNNLRSEPRFIDLMRRMNFE